MARPKKEAPQAEGSWLDTYADLVTLLLCFFVLLFSQSTIVDEKWKMLMEAFQNKEVVQDYTVVVNPEDQTEPGPGGNPGEAADLNFSDLAELIAQEVANSGADVSDNVEVSQAQNGSIVFLRLKDDLLFDLDSSVLRPKAREFIDKLGDMFVKFNEEIAMVRINGHSSRPYKEVNVGGINHRTLSSDRANAVSIYLEDVKKFDTMKLMSVGYGWNYPIASNETIEGQIKNRRVEILILGASPDGSAASYMQELLGGNMSLEEYQEVYGALNLLPPKDIASGGASDNLDYIDHIKLDDITGS